MIPMNTEGTKAIACIGFSGAGGRFAFSAAALLNPMRWTLKYMSETIDDGRVTIRQFLGLTLTTLRIDKCPEIPRS